MGYQKLLVLVLPAIAIGCSNKTAELDWDTDTARSANYRVTQEVGLENGAPERSYDRQVNLDFDGNGQLAVSIDGQAATFLPVTRGGHISSDIDTVPPQDVVIFLHLLPSDGVAAAKVGDAWESLHPSDQALADEPNRLSLQDRYRVTVTGIRDQQGQILVDLEIKGDVRLVDNNWLAGDMIPSTASPTMTAGIAALQQWTPNITGAATFDSTSHQLHSADISFLLVPRVGVSYGDILTSEHRRRVIAVAN